MISEARVKALVARAIRLNASKLDIYRKDPITDGAGGFTPGSPKLVTSFDAFLDFQKQFNPLSDILPRDGGTEKPTREVTLYAVYTGVELKVNDYFALNEKEYVIDSANLIFNSFWMCILKSDYNVG